MSIDLISTIFITIIGLLIGSFLNVVIYRMPRKLSVVKPRSSCPKCGHMVTWYENIPVISYLYLRGKCSSCHTKISLRYPLVELIMGLVAFLLAPRHLDYQSLATFIFYFSIAAIFLAHILIDLEHRLLLDKLNIYLLCIVTPYAIMNFSPFHWLLGGFIGFCGPLAISYLFYKLKNQEGLGGGDIKLFGVLGIILGPIGVMNNIFMSCSLGAIVGVTLILIKKLNKDTAFAFGPFILIVATAQIFFPSIVELINPFTIR